MFNGAVAEGSGEEAASRVMVDWVAVWQAARKRFESFSICDLFSKCVSSAHMLPACTCRRSQCLKLQPLDYATIPHFPTCHFHYVPAPNAVCSARVTPLHMDGIADKRRLMHVEGMAAPTHAHTSTKSPTYSYVSSTVPL